MSFSTAFKLYQDNRRGLGCTLCRADRIKPPRRQKPVIQSQGTFLFTDAFFFETTDKTFNQNCHLMQHNLFSLKLPR